MRPGNDVAHCGRAKLRRYPRAVRKKLEKNHNKFSKHPPLKPGGGFFVNPTGSGGEEEEKMNIPLIHLTEEERFVALTQVYMELELPLAAAVDAANADLRALGGGNQVAEAA
jgi:hypothetical protein